MLGVEDCCAVQLTPAPKPNEGVKVVAPPVGRESSAPVPPTAAASTKPPTTESKQQSASGFFAGIAKTMTDAIAQRVAAAESEKKSAALDNHLSLLKGGVLVTRHMPGEASKPVSIESAHLVQDYFLKLNIFLRSGSAWL